MFANNDKNFQLVGSAFLIVPTTLPVQLRIAVWKSLCTIAPPIFYIVGAQKDQCCKMSFFDLKGFNSPKKLSFCNSDNFFCNSYQIVLPLIFFCNSENNLRLWKNWNSDKNFQPWEKFASLRKLATLRKIGNSENNWQLWEKFPTLRKNCNSKKNLPL